MTVELTGVSELVKIELGDCSFEIVLGNCCVEIVLHDCCVEIALDKCCVEAIVGSGVVLLLERAVVIFLIVWMRCQ